jgi:hypothetical protein
MSGCQHRHICTGPSRPHCFKHHPALFSDWLDCSKQHSLPSSAVCTTHCPVVDPFGYTAMHSLRTDAASNSQRPSVRSKRRKLRFCRRGESVRRDDPCVTLNWLVLRDIPVNELLCFTMSGWKILDLMAFLFRDLRRPLGRGFRPAFTAARNPCCNS